jgi:hypothetical protein
MSSSKILPRRALIELARHYDAEWAATQDGAQPGQT